MGDQVSLNDVGFKKPKAYLLHFWLFKVAANAIKWQLISCDF